MEDVGVEEEAVTPVAETKPMQLGTTGEGEARPVTGGDDLPVTVIEARSGWQVVDFRELWRYRELLYFLTWRDVAVRYKQTVLGLGWAVAQPLATMVIFTQFLGRMGGVSEGVANYPLYVFAGMVPWAFFSNAVATAANSLVTNERLVTKVYFPRIILPLAAVGASLFDMMIASVLLFGMALAYGVWPGATILALPLVVVLLVVAAQGVGTLLSALIVSQRDFRHALSFGMQLWMFATPSIYLPPESVGPRGQWLLPLNPAYGLIVNFRQAATGGDLDLYSLGVSGVVGILLLVAGAVYFRRVERTFADVI